ncbi:WxcM-like domain-containing protein [Verrucomicrobium sp. BvORR106]|uniref:WxcM-like domain-containing protein n=1 Tax=Verrucomicrobium sp. BvORR106 TaxID=1403819 RepID=UPI0005707BDD|nr:WxcM-like domain-containing protein [Verrucomicrobium sp. BvORR106]
MTTASNIKLHPDARCHSLEVGEGAELEAFAFVESGARVGRDCFIGAHTYLEHGVSLGDKVTVEGGTRFYAGLVVEDDVHVGRNATLARAHHGGATPTAQTTPSILLRQGCQIGANATICPGVTVGAHAIVDAGAVVTHSVQHYAIVSGNPAHVVGFVNAKEPVSTGKGNINPQEVGVTVSRVRGVTAYDIPYISDPRGNLTVGEFERTLPFQPKRYFMTFDVPSAKLRGEHAHRTCHQFLICMHGSCALVVDDGVNREEYLLDRPTFGIYVPPMIWATEYKHTSDSALLVFASEYYDAGDYIRDYHQYLKELRPQ